MMLLQMSNQPVLVTKLHAANAALIFLAHIVIGRHVAVEFRPRRHSFAADSAEYREVLLFVNGVFVSARRLR